jgi:hypothetical protein
MSCFKNFFRFSSLPLPFYIIDKNSSSSSSRGDEMTRAEAATPASSHSF